MIDNTKDSLDIKLEVGEAIIYTYIIYASSPDKKFSTSFYTLKEYDIQIRSIAEARKSKINEELLIELHQQGLSQRKIAKIMNVSQPQYKFISQNINRYISNVE